MGLYIIKLIRDTYIRYKQNKDKNRAVEYLLVGLYLRSMNFNDIGYATFFLDYTSHDCV